MRLLVFSLVLLVLPSLGYSSTKQHCRVKFTTAQHETMICGNVPDVSPDNDNKMIHPRKGFPQTEDPQTLPSYKLHTHKIQKKLLI